jgi:hypothetical protein
MTRLSCHRFQANEVFALLAIGSLALLAAI